MTLQANAKLLLSGEYIVLSGAEALAIPLKFSQTLTVGEGPSGQITWISKAPYGVWFSATFKASGRVIETSSVKPAQFVSSIMAAINSIKPNFFHGFLGKKITIVADFDLNWGLGSSSSLIALLAQLSGIEPLALHWKVSKGSGYDVVAAVSQGPFIYKQTDRVATSTPSALPSVFSNCVYFAYLGKKEDSAAGIDRFLASGKKCSPHSIAEVSSITREMVKVETVDHLSTLIERHEVIISEILDIKPIKQLRFPDFQGSVKSLGAWGGDFAMFCTSMPTNQVYSYLAAKGLTPIFRFNDITFGYE